MRSLWHLRRPWRRPALARAVSLGVIVALGGVAPGAAAQEPPPERPEAQPPAPPERAAVSDPMLAKPPPPPRVLRSWKEVVQIVSTRDVEYAVALEEIERARGLRRQALAAALPTVTASGAVTFQIIRNDITTLDVGSGQQITTTVPNSPTAQAQLAARQPVLAPRAWYAIGTADAQVQLAKLSTEDRRRTLLASAASAVVAVVTAERAAEVNRVGLRAALERLELTRRREALGSGTKLDVVRFEQDVAVARSALVQGDESLLRAREALGLSLGETDAHGVTESFTLDGIEADARATCRPGEADDRADVRAARAQIALAERSVTDAELSYLPTAEVATTFLVSSEQLATTERYAWSVQGLLTIPIWDGGARYGAHRAAEAQVSQQRLRAEGATRAATLETRQADRGVRVAEQNLEVARTTRDLAARVSDLSQRSWEAGTGTSFDLVDAGRRLREAELQLAVRELELVQARLSALLASSSCTY